MHNVRCSFFRKIIADRSTSAVIQSYVKKQLTHKNIKDTMKNGYYFGSFSVLFSLLYFTVILSTFDNNWDGYNAVVSFNTSIFSNGFLTFVSTQRNTCLTLDAHAAGLTALARTTKYDKKKGTHFNFKRLPQCKYYLKTSKYKTKPVVSFPYYPEDRLL